MILVTGASGFIGRHLTAALASAGAPVRALARTPAAAERVRSAAGAGVEVAQGTLHDLAALSQAVEGVDCVVHLAGAYRGSPSGLHASHVEGTANLLSVLAPGTRLVYVSSTSVYGWDQRWPADHASAPAPCSDYGRAKLAAERLVRAWSEGFTVVARPTIVYGSGDENGMLVRAHRLLRRRVPFPGTGRNRIHLTHVDDVVRALVLLVEQGDGVFVLAGPEPAPLRRILGLLAQGAGLPPPRFAVPATLTAAAAAGLEAAWSAAGLAGEPPISRHAVEVATRDRAYSSRRAQEELGWTPLVGLDEGVPPVGAELSARTGAQPVTPAPARAGSTAGEVSAAAVASGNARAAGQSLGFDWRSYVEDPDEGLGTVYERFALDDVLADAVARTGAASVLHAPLFGMMGFPGLDAVALARSGVRVGLLDFDAERLEAVVAQWAELGLRPETHLVEGEDPRQWPRSLPASYDLVFSFAALWWFDDPWEVLSAQARWAKKGVLACVPNKNVFMRMRALLWHRQLFEELNEDALDRQRLERAGREAGLEPVATGLFDIPPFPDTSVPLAKVVRAALGKRSAAAAADSGSEGAWAWSILPYLRGEDPEMPDRVARLARWERFLPAAVAPGLAHHRYVLFVDPSAGPSTAGAGAVIHRA